MLFWHPNEMLEMQSTHRWSWMPFGECSEYAAINWLIIWRSFFDGPIFFLDHLLPWVCTTIFFIQNIFCITLEATVCKASFVNILLSSRQCLVANADQRSCDLQLVNKIMKFRNLELLGFNQLMQPVWQFRYWQTGDLSFPNIVRIYLHTILTIWIEPLKDYLSKKKSFFEDLSCSL